MEEPFATAKKDFDARIEIEKREKALAEERRVDGISSRIAEIGALVTAHVSSSSEVICDLFPRLNNDLATVDEWAMEERWTIKDRLDGAAQGGKTSYLA